MKARAVAIPTSRDRRRGIRKRGLPGAHRVTRRAASARSAPWHNASAVTLRNAHLAVVDRSKVLDYLLNEAHPDNGGKARFFGSIGYSLEDPEDLIQALREVAEHGEVVSRAESVHGEKYVVDGWLSMQTRGSRRWSIRTVWIIDRGNDAPRLVTAYPGQE
jgi:hypothetical protein